MLDRITELGGRLKRSRATLNESDMAFGIQKSACSYQIYVARWLARQSPTAIVPVKPPGGQIPNVLFVLMRCYYCRLVNVWYETSDGRGGRPDWAVSSDI